MAIGNPYMTHHYLKKTMMVYLVQLLTQKQLLHEQLGRGNQLQLKVRRRKISEKKKNTEKNGHEFIILSENGGSS